MSEAEKDLILHEEDTRRLNVVLTQIVDGAHVSCILLINKSGRLVTAQSETSKYDRTSLAALAAGNFASSGTLAQMIGESEFGSTYQKGKRTHVYSTLLEHNTILVCIFDKRATLENLTSHIEQHKARLLSLLRSIYEGVESDPAINLDVSSTPDSNPAEDTDHAPPDNEDLVSRG